MAGEPVHTPGPWAIRYSYDVHRSGSGMCVQTCGRGQKPRRVWDDAAGLEKIRRGGDSAIAWGPEMHEMPTGRFEQMLGPAREVIFGVGQDYNDYGDAPTAANARLIAAAPDLLAALEAVERHGFWGVQDQVRGAIAKARGQDVPESGSETPPTGHPDRGTP